MIVTAWNDGAHSRNGKGYGFRVHPDDRDAYFQKEWTSIVLEIEGISEPLDTPIKTESLWAETPGPVHSDAVGSWLRKHGIAPWGRGNPPVFVLDPLGDNRFKVEKASKRHGA